MNTTIHKFLLTAWPTHHFIPLGAKFLCVQSQNDQPQMWFEVDPKAEKIQRNYLAVGTGHELPPEPRNYLGTFQLDSGALVFHLYELLQ